MNKDIAQILVLLVVIVICLLWVTSEVLSEIKKLERRITVLESVIVERTK
jgi:hypothetical protein